MGATCWYWLEDIDLNDATTLHGPVSATMVGPTAVGLVGLEVDSSPGPGAGIGWMLAIREELLFFGAISAANKRDEPGRGEADNDREVQWSDR